MKDLEKQAYEKLRRSFVYYEKNSTFHDENLAKIIEISRKIGCKQLLRYASMSHEELAKLNNTIATTANEKLTNFMRDYYETALLFSTIYGGINLISNPSSGSLTPEVTNIVAETISSCCSFYVEYDGIKDSIVLPIVSTIQEKGVLCVLNALRFGYTSSGFLQLRDLFYSAENKYSPIIEVVNALTAFLLDYPISEIA